MIGLKRAWQYVSLHAAFFKVSRKACWVRARAQIPGSKGVASHVGDVSRRRLRGDSAKRSLAVGAVQRMQPLLGSADGCSTTTASTNSSVHAASSTTTDSDEGLRRVKSPRCCGGVLDDASRRSKHCAADYLDGMRFWRKTLSAALFMFFATFFSTVALGALIQKTTNQRIGLVEYLLMNACAGVAHSLLGAQPLLVLRPTGPITSIIEKLSVLADLLHLDFWRYFAATGACVGLLMALVASLELSRFIRRVTPFTHDVFACFVCSIYLHDGVTDIIKRFGQSPFGEALLETNLAILTFGVSLLLFGAPHWSLLPPSFRSLLRDYAVTIAVLLAALATYLITTHAGVTVQRIPLLASIGSSFSPTCWWEEEDHYYDLSSSALYTPTCANATSIADSSSADPRPWLSWLAASGTTTTIYSILKLWAISFLSSIPITFFFYMDQNISSYYASCLQWA